MHTLWYAFVRYSCQGVIPLPPRPHRLKPFLQQLKAISIGICGSQAQGQRSMPIWAAPKPSLTMAGLGNSLERYEAEPDCFCKGALLTCTHGIGWHFLSVIGGSVPRCLYHKITNAVCKPYSIIFSLNSHGTIISTLEIRKWALQMTCNPKATWLLKW